MPRKIVPPVSAPPQPEPIEPEPEPFVEAAAEPVAEPEVAPVPESQLSAETLPEPVTFARVYDVFASDVQALKAIIRDVVAGDSLRQREQAASPAIELLDNLLK